LTKKENPRKIAVFKNVDGIKDELFCLREPAAGASRWRKFVDNWSRSFPPEEM